MKSEGFSRLTAAVMERGTNRVHAVIGNGNGNSKVTVQSIEFAKPQLTDIDNEADAAPAKSEKPIPATNAKVFGKSTSNGTAVNHTSQQPLKESRRASSGSTVLIEQPPSGDMSEVTVSMWGLPPEDTEGTEPQKGGQRPTSVTYERRTLDEHEQAMQAGESEQRVWVDTPSFSGPDRRHHSISPEVERRRSVPPRLKAGVRLEQERYLRLKLATMETGRTQQDIITTALDEFLDTLGVDRFIRVAMGFGGAASSFDKNKTDN